METVLNPQCSPYSFHCRSIESILLSSNRPPDFKPNLTQPQSQPSSYLLTNNNHSIHYTGDKTHFSTEFKNTNFWCSGQRYTQNPPQKDYKHLSSSCGGSSERSSTVPKRTNQFFPRSNSGGNLTTSQLTMNNNGMDIEGNDPNILMDNTLEPQIRERCNTWPLRPIINPPPVQDSESNPPPIQEEPEDYDGSTHNLSSGSHGLNSSELGSTGDLNAKKQSSRKNAWGNLSYAELITQAINSSPDKRLTLSQIYDWMVQNVSYFRDKGDSNSSAGWKNSIRHNLSLHNRFMRIQNEGAGKSSWWVINPDAKPGKAPRRPRGGSMDSKSNSMKAKRERAMRKVEELRKKGDHRTHSPVSPGTHPFTLSPGDQEQRYRERASSFLSDYSGRHSPPHDDQLNDKISPWTSESQLNDFIPADGYTMDTGPLTDDLEQMMKVKELPDPSASFLNELDEIGAPGNENMIGMPGPMAPTYQNRPYQTYENMNYNNPPPYPNADPTFNKTATDNLQPIYRNDPMMSPYNTSGPATNVSPSLQHRQFANVPYTNGGISNQNMRPANTQNRTGMSVNQALQSNSTTSATRPTVSPALRASAPILTQQLIGGGNNYSAPLRPAAPQRIPITQTSFTQPHSQTSTTLNTPQPGMTNFEPRFPADAANLAGNPDSFLSDIDLSLEDLNSLSCDVNQVIQQELRMDGGQIDFSGFEGYSQSQSS